LYVCGSDAEVARLVKARPVPAAPLELSADADRARREGGLLGEAEAGPFAALAVLKKS
jgi:hypothetical protein